MALVRLRVVCTAQRREPVLALLGERVGVVAVTRDEAGDALVWDELTSRTGEESTLTWTFLAFMLLATVLAGIGGPSSSTRPAGSRWSPARPACCH